ncbi:alpha/beta-hydrolase [Polychaeton citri CBS 116435]|uniref:Alpha/beta-hydrolase n=1 Tax=Polychaeton citri CBS 116435 TaxID=1314669 RepID=A0A9P4QAX1_9PEZI|nr:alpha/beta-hydrolase [Polychaeton citri CBS 116435]
MSQPAIDEDDPSYYPPSFVVQPVSGTHKATIICLHGRGDNGKHFGQLFLLAMGISTDDTGTKPSIYDSETPLFTALQSDLRDTKFVFPTASRRPVKAFKNIPQHQWFDILSIKDQEREVEVQYEGLRETTLNVHGLLRESIAEVGADNVALWGLSQGCASALIATLLWEGKPFKACVGMCGWLPLRKGMSDHTAAAKADMEDDDLRTYKGSEANMALDSQQSTPLQTARNYLTDILNLPPGSDASMSNPLEASLLSIPIFLGHGLLDDKVPITLHAEAATLLGRLGFSIEWKQYMNLGHWYSQSMLADIASFTRKQTK